MSYVRKPEWLKIHSSSGDGFAQIKGKGILREWNPTVCEEVNYPNLGEYCLFSTRYQD